MFQICDNSLWALLIVESDVNSTPLRSFAITSLKIFCERALNIMSGSRAYTDKTLKRLFGLSRNICSFPDCEKEMSDENSAKHSNICHIEAANNGGERYRSDMTDQERADYDNLILLCPPCHDKTNDIEIYSVNVLVKIKKDHELEMRKRVSLGQVLSKRPSLLAQTITQICNVEIEEYGEHPVTHSFTIEDKLDYNRVIIYRPIIEELRVYQAKLNTLYIEIERDGNGKKAILLRNISNLYLKVKGEILGEDQSQKNIQSNADKLIETVERA
ncbi:MAG: hypothetical protein Q9M22_07045, partial [Mariprofundaceae bacterium]|nr:hypothetical protein [Mariprofundaceae bacterium]